MKKLDEITIADLMPDSISQDAQVSATARAIDPQLRLVSEAVGKPLILYSIDDLDAGVLEHLAVQYDVTAWDSAWPIDTKRAVLKTAIADKRKKGTRGAVQRAIEAIAPVATITEWWQADPPETPHTFRIDVLQDGSPVDAETQADVIAQVNEAKPVRSHFTFNVGQLLGGDLYFAGVLRAIAYARVRDSGIVLEQMGIRAGILAAMRGMSIRRILAETEMGEMPEPTPSADTLELLLGFKNTGNGWESVQPTSSSKFWAGILNEIDHYEVEKFGLQVYTNSSAGSIGSIVIDYTFGVELLGVYTDTGGSNPVEMGNRWRFVANDQPSGPTTYLAINNSFLFELNVRTYRARFTKRASADVEVYFTSGGAGTSGWTNGNIKNVYWGGEYVLFDNGKTYEIVGVYNGETQLSGPFYIGTTNDSIGYGTRIQIKNGSGSTIAIATRVVIRITNRDEREAWLNPDKSNLTMSQNRRVYNSYGSNYVENMERRFEIIRFEDANGNVVTTNNTFSFDTSSYKTFRINITSGPSITAAKLVYRSLPTTKRAWLKSDHTGKDLSSNTAYYLFNDDNLRIKNDGLVTLGSGNNILAVFNSEMVEVNKSGLVFVHYTSDGVDYLLLQNNSPSTKTGIACVIYKET